MKVPVVITLILTEWYLVFYRLYPQFHEDSKIEKNVLYNQLFGPWCCFWVTSSAHLRQTMP